jgi:hypothetical protein
MKSLRAALVAALMALGGAAAAAGPVQDIEVYRSPSCGCCEKWVAHLRDAGFRVRVVDLEAINRMKAKLGVPMDLRSCHTAVVGNYVIEGHVPAADVRRVLAEKPAVRGIAVPGMPVGSPGMEGGTPEAYPVVAWGERGTSIFARH